MEINILDSPTYARAVELARNCCCEGYEAQVAGFSLCFRAAEIAETSPYSYCQTFDMVYDLAARGWFNFAPLAELPRKAVLSDLRDALLNAKPVGGHLGFSAKYINSQSQANV